MKEEYDKYYKKGGSYELPTEIFNNLLAQLEAINKATKYIKDKEDKLREYVKSNWVIDEPIKFKNDILQILNEGGKE